MSSTAYSELKRSTQSLLDRNIEPSLEAFQHFFPHIIKDQLQYASIRNEVDRWKHKHREGRRQIGVDVTLVPFQRPETDKATRKYSRKRAANLNRVSLSPGGNEDISNDHVSGCNDNRKRAVVNETLGSEDEREYNIESVATEEKGTVHDIVTIGNKLKMRKISLDSTVPSPPHECIEASIATNKIGDKEPSSESRGNDYNEEINATMSTVSIKKRETHMLSSKSTDPSGESESVEATANDVGIQKGAQSQENLNVEEESFVFPFCNEHRNNETVHGNLTVLPNDHEENGVRPITPTDDVSSLSSRRGQAEDTQNASVKKRKGHEVGNSVDAELAQDQGLRKKTKLRIKITKPKPIPFKKANDEEGYMKVKKIIQGIMDEGIQRPASEFYKKYPELTQKYGKSSLSNGIGGIVFKYKAKKAVMERKEQSIFHSQDEETKRHPIPCTKTNDEEGYMKVKKMIQGKMDEGIQRPASESYATKVPDNSGLFHLMKAATALSQLVDSGKDSTGSAATGTSPSSSILQQNVEMSPQGNVHIAPNGSVPLHKASTPAAKEKKAAPTHQARQIFPKRLMRILSDANLSDVITWLPHGRSFVIIQRDELVEKVLPIYFPESSTSGKSFIRKLNRWGFRQVTRGPDAGAYHHHLFIRDEPNMCLQMVCKRSHRRKDDGKYPGHSMLPRHDFPNTAQHAQTEFAQESDTHRTGSPTEMNNQTAIVANSFSPTPTKTSVTKNLNIGGYPHPPGSYRLPSYTANAPFVHLHTMPPIPPFPTNGPYGRMMPYMPYGQPPFGMNAPGPYKLAQVQSPNKPAIGKAEEVPESTTTCISSNESDTNNKSTEKGEPEIAKKNEEDRLATARSMLFNAYMKALGPNASIPNKPVIGKAEEVPGSTTTSISSNEGDTNNESTEQGETTNVKKEEEERLATAKSMLFNAYMKTQESLQIEAKNGLENYCYSLKTSISSPEVEGKIPADEKTKLEGAIDETLQWLDSNLSIEKEEYEKRQKALEAIAVPLFEHLKALETDKCVDNEETNSAHQCTDEIVVSEQSKSIEVTDFDKFQEEKTRALAEWILVEIIKFNSANVRLKCKEYAEELIKLGFYDREMMKNFCTVEIIDSKEFTSFMKLAHRLSLKKWLLEHGASK